MILEEKVIGKDNVSENEVASCNAELIKLITPEYMARNEGIKTTLLLGPSCSGKDYAGKIINEINFSIEIISVGDKLKEKSKTDSEILACQAAGKLVSIEKVFETVLEAIDNKTNVVLDGFPRNCMQLEMLSILIDYGIVELTAIFLLDAPLEIRMARNLERANKDIAAGKEPRKDANLEVFLRREEVYEDETMPAITKLMNVNEYKSLFYIVKTDNDKEALKELLARRL